jgi:cysteine sulfinate desulfinase/cysteine desulfurase-like protein
MVLASDSEQSLRSEFCLFKGPSAESRSGSYPSRQLRLGCRNMANLQALGAAAGLGSASRDTLSDEMKQCNDSLEALLSSYEAILTHSR